MATFVGTSHRVYLAHLDLSGLANEVEFGELSANMVDFTTFNDGAYRCVKPGVISGAGRVKGFQDYAADVLDDEISIGQLGTQYAFTVVPSATGTITAGDPCWLTRGLLGEETFPFVKGEAGAFEFGLNYDTVATRGYVAHPLAARTADGTGTAIAQAGPTATQRLYAALHVTAYSGFSNVVFKVQSDDSGGFASATDRITFSTVTGVTNEFASVAGSFSSETHLRAFWDVTGSGSVGFTMAFAVL